MFFSAGEKQYRRGTFFILGVRVDNTDGAEALGLIDRIVTSRNGLPTHTVFFTNVHSIYLARKDRELRRIINQADMVLPDGSGLKIAGKLFGQPVIENLNGTDFIPRVLAKAQEKGWSVYLLGGRQDVVNRCAARLAERYPSVRVVGTHRGYFHMEDEQRILDDINQKRPDLLLVALGSPLQEKWIARHINELRVALCFGVGGLFDFLSGMVPRAPRWMRKLGIEWLYRFLHDPAQKWERVLIEMPVFLTLVFAKRFIPRSIRELIARVRLAR